MIKDKTIMQIERIEGNLLHDSKVRADGYMGIKRELLEEIVALFKELYNENRALKDEIAELLVEMKESDTRSEG